MPRPVYDWVRDLPAMFATGLARLVDWLMSTLRTYTERVTALYTRYPSAPAHVIQSALDWVAESYAAAHALAAGGMYTAPIIAYPTGPVSPTEYVYDVVVPYVMPDSGERGRLRLDMHSGQRLTIQELSAAAEAQLAQMLEDIGNQSPGSVPTGTAHPLDLLVLSTYQQ